MLRYALEAGEIGAEGETVAAAIETRLRTGRPLAAEEWIAEKEAATGRALAPKKRGPKSRQASSSQSVLSDAPAKKS